MNILLLSGTPVGAVVTGADPEGEGSEVCPAGPASLPGPAGSPVPVDGVSAEVILFSWEPCVSKEAPLPLLL